ncbi:nuclear transport factor 2 family protein [Saccharothrix sp. NPDC042600]|uniref:nuclear transport factor 2 family protein n=1 Tax=Saccharothrix TaxID=2071 RepID=UPI0033C2E0AB|nr:nuclear transport factor 2 family protein [Saccharothrix mutabilis subsp. capreolus]
MSTGAAIAVVGVTATEADAEDVITDPLAATREMAVRFDLRQWDRLVQVFTPEVRVDYTRLVGGEPATVPAAALVADWRRNLGHLAATQHVLANQAVLVTGREATATADFQAAHRDGPLVGGRLWVLGGRYDYRLTRVGRGWRIGAVTMHPLWEYGDRTVIGLPAGG